MNYKQRWGLQHAAWETYAIFASPLVHPCYRWHSPIREPHVILKHSHGKWVTWKQSNPLQTSCFYHKYCSKDKEYPIPTLNQFFNKLLSNVMSHPHQGEPARWGAWWYEVLAKPVVSPHSESERMWVTDIIAPRRRNPGRNVPVFSDSITTYRLKSLTG